MADVFVDEFHISVGDTKPLDDQLLDQAGNPVDLTGASLAFRFNGGAGTGTPNIEGDPTLGQVRYTWGSAETATRGVFRAQWLVTIGGLTESYPRPGYIKISIQPKA